MFIQLNMREDLSELPNFTIDKMVKTFMIKGIHPMTEVIVVSFSLMFFGYMWFLAFNQMFIFWTTFGVSLIVGGRYDYLKFKSRPKKGA